MYTVLQIYRHRVFFFALKWPLLKVRQSRNDFFKPTILPLIERTNSTLLLWYIRSTYFCSCFGRNWRHQKKHFEINWPLVNREKLTEFMNELPWYVRATHTNMYLHVCNTKWFPFCNDSCIKSEHCDETIYIPSMILYTALRKIIIMKRLLAAMLPLKVS